MVYINFLCSWGIVFDNCTKNIVLCENKTLADVVITTMYLIPDVLRILSYAIIMGSLITCTCLHNCLFCWNQTFKHMTNSNKFRTTIYKIVFLNFSGRLFYKVPVERLCNFTRSYKCLVLFYGRGGFHLKIRVDLLFCFAVRRWQLLTWVKWTGVLLIFIFKTKLQNLLFWLHVSSHNVLVF